MAYGKQDINGQLYVFSSNNGAKVHNQCIIDSHGGQFAFGNTRNVGFLVPANVSLKFYAPHNKPVEYNSMVRTYTDGRSFNYTSDVSQVLSGGGGAIETLAANERSSDYVLTKIQASHISGHSGRSQVAYEDLEKLMAYYSQSKMDIVTIRDRYEFGKMTMTLSKLISLLRSQGYDYEVFHCLFCRSPLWKASTKK